MRKDLVKIQPLRSSFLSCEKDTETILKTLFVDSKPYSDILKRLLIINNPDCLDLQNEDYKKMIDSISLGEMVDDQGYIRLNPKIARGTHENIKAYILISFDNFSPSRRNPEFRDCTVNFDIICYMDEWCLDNYQVRPLKICGYIDGILNSLTDKNKMAKSLGNNIHMSGFGAYKFLGCNLAVLNEDISMYTLSYRALHFTQDLGDMNVE